MLSTSSIQLLHSTNIPHEKRATIDRDEKCQQLYPDHPTNQNNEDIPQSHLRQDGVQIPSELFRCVVARSCLTSCAGRCELNCLGTFIGKSLFVFFDRHVQFLHLLVLDFPNLMCNLTNQSKVVRNQDNPSRKLDTRLCQRINRLSKSASCLTKKGGEGGF